MANPYSVSNYLVPSLKRRGMIPSTAGTLTDADFIAILDEELQTYVTGLLLEANEEYLVADYDVAIPASGSLELPPRCVADTLRLVQISSTSSGYTDLTRIEPERVQDYSTTGGVAGYVLQGNNLVLVPTPTSVSGTLRLKYERRPNRLVADAASGLITSINAGAKQVQVSAAPATFTPGALYDLVAGSPQFETRAMDKYATIAGNTLTFTDALPASLMVGDYVNLTGEACIPQVPHHLHSLLVQRAKFVVLDTVNDKNAANAGQVCEQMREQALKMMVKRVLGSPRYVINRNGPGYRGRSRGRF